MESPPKRMTRSRAAKVTEPTLKTTRIVTAAARAKASTSTVDTKRTSIKRKTPDDEANDEDADELEDAHDMAKKPTRGRPRKVAVTESKSAETKPATATLGRGRPTKRVATIATKTESTTIKAPRGRPKKKIEPEAAATVGPVQATTQASRSRLTATKSSAKASQPVARKIVKFQEPGKENDGPAPAKESSTSSGMRARPARRAPGPSTRATKAGVKDTLNSSAKPLSPKKVTQISIAKMDSSEDELAGGDTPLKRMQKPTALAPLDDAEDNTMTINNAILNPPELGGTSMGSPARRPPTSPFKDCLKSPARKMGSIQLPTSMMKPRKNSGDCAVTWPGKTLMQSAAKRPQSPIKGLLFQSSSQSQHQTSPSRSSVLQSPAKRALPGYKPRQVSPEKTEMTLLEGTPRMRPIMSTPSASRSRRPSEKLMDNVSLENLAEEEENVFTGPVGSLKFPGRLSAVLPRDIDPAEVEDQVEMTLTADVEAVQFEEQAVGNNLTIEPGAAKEAVRELEQDSTVDQAASKMQSCPAPSREADSAPQYASITPANPMYQLRAKDLEPGYDMNWESEDDLSPTKATDTTTFSFTGSPSKSRRTTMGLTSLADRLDSWSPADPIERRVEPGVRCTSTAVDTVEPVEEDVDEALEEAPESIAPSSDAFFDQEMSARVSSSNMVLCDPYLAEGLVMDDPILEDTVVTDEDVNLAKEAEEMSLGGEPDGRSNNVPEGSFSDEVSEASQEYADENQTPVDPELANGLIRHPVTPVRQAIQLFNTTTKVPLKPADYSTPSPVKRSFSASRVAPRRPSGPTRNDTSLSSQPNKGEYTTVSREDAAYANPSTPAKPDIWSRMGTPARTPRRDVNPLMLRGAVVFVDVHTSEGADASGIFVDLLHQMGARCVKTWNWTPDSEGRTQKCGITHVVFKDGGKRTMERVRQANGVVHCVGVTWVLDCERENEWLDEAPYYVDRSFVPRGGARRRKSMEPKVLANMNGTIVNHGTSKDSSSHDTQSTPKTPINRRQSTVWMHTPSDQAENAEDDDDYDWSRYLMLTPVPKTPAPEAVARYAADIPTTPSDDSSGSSPEFEDLLMRTCPPKSGKFHATDTDIMGTCPPISITYEDLGVGILGGGKDEHVRMRLMAARRKSLQFAPKIGSPLARTWM